MFGYYIEVSKSNLHAVPSDYQRKQTIAGGERFVTPALKDYEEKVLGADERIVERELELFEALRRRVAAEAPRILDTARALAALDVLAGLAETATVCNYTKPLVDDGDELVAVDLRHPVVERLAGGAFVPNDVTLNATTHQLVILTGPNMGGKSTYLRQVALLCAAGADRLVRAGARSQGRDRRSHLRARRRVRQHRARPVDLHGRDAGDRAHPERRDVAQPGRARRDRPRHGDLRRAQHCVGGGGTPGEERARAAASTLFATHYHELTDLADALPGVVNAHVTAREWKDDIVFLHKILPGRSDRSYGIQVARLAGPAGVGRGARARHPQRARARRAVARRPPGAERRRAGRTAAAGPVSSGRQTARRESTSALREIDLNRTTPLEALQLLADLKRELDERGDVVTLRSMSRDLDSRHSQQITTSPDR